MELVDYAINDLLRPISEGPLLRFVPREHAALYRSALAKLARDRYYVAWIDLIDVKSQARLFDVFSKAISAPGSIESWGGFEDFLSSLSWIHGAEGYFFYLENALSLWQTQTPLAGALSDELQLAMLTLSTRRLHAKAIFELR